jgi:hypothetical protein
MALSHYRVLVTERIRDTAGKLTLADKDSAIQEALTLYSRHRPRRRVQQLSGDGAAFTFALASDFEERFSLIESIEYPVDQQEPELLDEGDFGFYRDLTTGVLKLRFFALILAANEKAYVSYTARHTVNDSGQDTAPLADRDAIADLATAILALELAALYGQTSDSTIGADAVDYRSKSAEYRALAARYEDRYRRHIGLPEDGPLAASAVGDLDLDLGEGLGPRFFHGARFR